MALIFLVIGNYLPKSIGLATKNHSESSNSVARKLGYLMVAMSLALLISLYFNPYTTIIILGVFVFIVRQQLAGYRAKGPKYLLIMYIASLVLEVFYIGAGSLLSGVNLLTSSESSIMLISSILVSLFMIGANKVYFDKRAHLFTR